MEKTYFKFKKFNDYWILPVWKDSLMYKNPNECFSWDKNIFFVSEVSEEEYDKQFIPKKCYVQLELDLF